MSNGEAATLPHDVSSERRMGLAGGQGLRIYSTLGVPEGARDSIETAIQRDDFKSKGKAGEGREVLYIQTAEQDWLAVVDVTDAIMVKAAYKTSAETVDREAEALLSAYRSR